MSVALLPSWTHARHSSWRSVIRRAEDGSGAVKTPTLIALLRALDTPAGEFLDAVAKQIDQAGGLDPE